MNGMATESESATLSRQYLPLGDSSVPFLILSILSRQLRACNSRGVTSTGGNSAISSSTPVVPKSLNFRAVTNTLVSNEATALL